MSSNFKAIGADALLAIAACERTTSLSGNSETKPGQNVAFAYGAVGRLFPFDGEESFGQRGGDTNLTVQVQRILTRPGVDRYQCTIQSDVNGALR